MFAFSLENVHAGILKQAPIYYLFNFATVKLFSFLF